MEGDALLVLTLNPICRKMFFGFADVIFFLKKKGNRVSNQNLSHGRITEERVTRAQVAGPATFIRL